MFTVTTNGPAMKYRNITLTCQPIITLNLIYRSLDVFYQGYTNTPLSEDICLQLPLKISYIAQPDEY
jgi:hypothetical protein